VFDGQVINLAAATGLATLADCVGSDLYAQRDALLAKGSKVAALDAVQLLCPITRPEKMVCAVRKYKDHHHEALAAGLQRELSAEPPIFLRVWRANTPHNGPIVRPRVSERWTGKANSP
jgi:2-keto-4-pentenoate hydratase/2-oxohepta-3-ene-1,7-dioic acid hydratase in catechol pathway